MRVIICFTPFALFVVFFGSRAGPRSRNRAPLRGRFIGRIAARILLIASSQAPTILEFGRSARFLIVSHLLSNLIQALYRLLSVATYCRSTSSSTPAGRSALQRGDVLTQRCSFSPLAKQKHGFVSSGQQACPSDFLPSAQLARGSRQTGFTGTPSFLSSSSNSAAKRACCRASVPKNAFKPVFL